MLRNLENTKEWTLKRTRYLYRILSLLISTTSHVTSWKSEVKWRCSDVFYQVKDNFCNWFNSSKSLYFLKNYINALYPLLKSAIFFYNAIIWLFDNSFLWIVLYPFKILALFCQHCLQSWYQFFSNAVVLHKMFFKKPSYCFPSYINI